MTLSFLSWPHSYLVEKGTEKMGIRVVERKEGLLLPRFLYWGSHLTVSIIWTADTWHWFAPFLITNNGTRHWARIPPPVPTSVAAFAIFMYICCVYMSCCLPCLWLQLWELVYPLLNWARVRSRKKSQEMACPQPRQLLSLVPPEEQLGSQERGQGKSKGKTGFSSVTWSFPSLTF